MRSSSITFSIMFHVGMIIIGLISFPWLKKDFVIPPPISVEFVEISKITETNKVSPQPTPKKEDKPVDKPPPVAKNTANEAVVPVKTEEKKEDKPEKKEDTVLVDKTAPPEKKKTPKEEKKKEVTKEEPKKDFASVLKNLDVSEDTPPVKADLPDLKLDEPAAAEGQQAPLGARLTMSEEDALRRQLESCWSFPYGAKDADTLRVEVFMVINPDRTLREARVVDKSRYNSDSFFRAAADSAMRAVNSPNCSPFELPSDKYDTWKNTTVTFDPSQLF